MQLHEYVVFVYSLSYKFWSNETEDYLSQSATVVAASVEDAIRSSKKAGLIPRKAVVYDCKMLQTVDHVVIQNQY
jgi:hypothetical protein